MKLYQNAMEHCAPPEGLEERLRAAVLAAEPPEKRRVFRPRGFARRAVLAAVIAALLTVSAGAVLGWNAILTGRFGELAASTPMGQAAFQDVFVISVCDDVTLTVRQALVSDETIYLVLDYQLPDTVDRAWLQEVCESADGYVHAPHISYYATGDVTWEALKAADADTWAGLDWTDFTSCGGYLMDGSLLRPYRFTGGSSGGSEFQGYDPEANTLTYLLRHTTESDTQTLDSQPLTLLVSPPWTQGADGEQTPLADHPAILTFQPEYASQTLTGAWQDPESGQTLNATLSPFSIQVKSYLGAFTGVSDLYQATALVFRDGTVTPLKGLVQGLGGSSGGPADAPYPASVSFSTSFLDLLDVTRVEAVRVGAAVIPLT